MTAAEKVASEIVDRLDRQATRVNIRLEHKTEACTLYTRMIQRAIDEETRSLREQLMVAEAKLAAQSLRS